MSHLVSGLSPHPGLSLWFSLVFWRPHAIFDVNDRIGRFAVASFVDRDQKPVASTSERWPHAKRPSGIRWWRPKIGPRISDVAVLAEIERHADALFRYARVLRRNVRSAHVRSPQCVTETEGTHPGLVDVLARTWEGGTARRRRLHVRSVVLALLEVRIDGVCLLGSVKLGTNNGREAVVGSLRFSREIRRLRTLRFGLLFVEVGGTTVPVGTVLPGEVVARNKMFLYGSPLRCSEDGDETFDGKITVRVIDDPRLRLRCKKLFVVDYLRLAKSAVPRFGIG